MNTSVSSNDLVSDAWGRAVRIAIKIPFIARDNDSELSYKKVKSMVKLAAFLAMICSKNKDTARWAQAWIRHRDSDTTYVKAEDV